MFDFGVIFKWYIRYAPYQFGGMEPLTTPKDTHGVSEQFFFHMNRVQKHYVYVKIKQFSKLEIKQIDISTVIMTIKFLDYY